MIIARRMHRTERGSAGSNSLTWRVNVIDPALPRSVLCRLRRARAEAFDDFVAEGAGVGFDGGFVES
jgi:hypothetical protein